MWCEGKPPGVTNGVFSLELAEREKSEGVAAGDGSFFLPGNPAREAVLLIHGTPGTAAEMRPLAGSLNRRGHSVLVPLLPGHGRGERALGMTRWEECRARAEECWRLARGVSSPHHRGAHLVGYSFGGFLSLLLAADSPPSALVTLAAYVYPRSRAWHRPVRPALRLRARLGSPRWRWKVQLADLAPRALAALPRISCRALVIHGEDDAVVSPESARAIYRGLASEDKALRLLPGRGHLLLAGEHRIPHASGDGGGRECEREGEIELEVVEFLGREERASRPV